MNALTNVLTDSELDRLEELLESELFDHEAMLLDELQGFICALISGPETVAPGVWLPEALGPGIAAADDPGVRETIDLAIRFYNQHASALQAGEWFALYLYPEEEAEESEAPDAEPAYDYRMWCDAYLFGTTLGAAWHSAAGKHEEDLAELLESFYLLSGVLKEETEKAGEAWLTPGEEARLLEQKKETLQWTVQAVYNFWLARRGGATVRREEPKIGRNDLCPCGSGKKYKQCCGSPEKLN